MLLGHEDDDRIGLLGDPEGGPMARPEALWLDRRLRQRQHRTRRQDLLAPDDDRAIVERRPRAEDRRQQVGRQLAVDRDAGLGDLAEAGLPLDDHERAVAVGGQQPGGM